MSGSLLVINARVVTMDPARPMAGAVAVGRGRIVAVGTEADARAAALPDARVLDARGRVVVPGFIDPHVHLAAWAAALRAVDCAPPHARSIVDIVRLIRERARQTPPGEWVRAAGYDESALAEGRHPTRWDLDAATSDHPVRLLHRSGHAVVLNSRAMALAGITTATAEPPGALIDRRLSDGEPTGLLLEMNESIARAVPPLPRAELVAGMGEAGRRLLAAGVTAVQDMSHTNDAATPRFLAELAATGGFRPRVLPPAAGWVADHPPRARSRRPVKVMLREISDRPVPDVPELVEIIRTWASYGRQVAVHAVERQSVMAVVTAFEQVGPAARTADLRHRIEHAGVCPPELAERIARLGLVVVSNPGFLYHSGARYRRQVAPDDLPHLYAVGTLHTAGVRVAAASDAPVTPPSPLLAIRTAATRQDSTGGRLPGAGLAPLPALALHTTEAAFAAGVEEGCGRIRPGMAGDLVLLSGDPAAAETRVEVTVLGGEVVWEREA